MSHPYFALPTPIVIGHRGAAGERPENTLASFTRALEQGAAILETDAHPTRDGRVVLFHDETLERTTNGRGRLVDHSLAELQALDAGWHFASKDAPGATPFRGRGCRIPTLDEVLHTFPGVRLNIELKEDAPGFVGSVLALLRDAGREEATLLTSGEDALMTSLRAQVAASGSRVALGASAGDVLRFVKAALDGAAPPAGVMALQVPAEFAGRPLVTPPLIESAHAHGVQVHVWTINDEPEMERLLDLGVDGLVSDFPGRMRALLERRASTARARGGEVGSLDR